MRELLRRLLPSCRHVLLLLVLVPGAGEAQTVRGTLLDEEHRRPVPGARLQLVDSAGTAVDSTTTDAAGAYRLRAAAAGTHMVSFQVEGYASFSSDTLTLLQGGTRSFEFRVPLMSNAALRRISDILHADARLQESLPEICGEPFRPWEAGLLIGVVRQRAGEQPLAGVRVSAQGTAEDDVRSTISTDKGVYVLCNVRAGKAVKISAQLPGRAAEASAVEVRAGSVAWHDILLGPRAR